MNVLQRALFVFAMMLAVCVCVAIWTTNPQARDMAREVAEQTEQYQHLRGTIFGTTYQIKHSPFSAAETERLRQRLLRGLQDVDQVISSYRRDSTLSVFNAKTPAPQRIENQLLHRAVEIGLRVGKESDGALDITLPPLLKAWGLGPFTPRRHTPTDSEIEEALKKIGSNQVDLSPDSKTVIREKDSVQIDVTALGEGIALDLLASIFDEFGVANYYVEIGGEAKAKGVNSQGRTWRVGIERPEKDATKLWCVVELNGVGVSTSGNYQQFLEYDGKIYSHLLDPRTGKPCTHNLVSVSVIHASSAEADAWDTALMVLGPEKGWAKAVENNLAALFISREGTELIGRATPEFERRMRAR